jgi:hypothetical protein
MAALGHGAGGHCFDGCEVDIIKCRFLRDVVVLELDKLGKGRRIWKLQTRVLNIVLALFNKNSQHSMSACVIPWQIET